MHFFCLDLFFFLRNCQLDIFRVELRCRVQRSDRCVNFEIDFH